MVSYDLKEYLNEIKKYSTLTKEEEIELFKNINNQEAFLKIFNSNLKLVISIAKKYFNIPCSLSKMDLIQEGNMGLVKAIRKFKLDYNVRFVTFAYDWINHYIARAIKNNGYVIRIPVSRHDNYILYETTKEKIEQQLGADISKEEVYNIMNVSDSYIKELEKTERIKNTGSLNVILGEDIELINCISKKEKDILDKIVSTEEKIEKRNLMKNIIYNSGLKEKQIQMILLRYGFVDNIPKTYVEIGEILNITKQAVEQQIKKCLKKMKDSSYYYESNEFNDNLDKKKKL